MSQKPKAGVPARTAPATKVVPKAEAMKAAPAKAPAATKVEPQAKVEPVPAPRMAVVQPTSKPLPAALPVAKVSPETEATAPDPVNETIAAASDLAAASAKVVSTSIKATADTVAAVTAEVVEPTSTSKPTKPTLTQGIKTMMKSTEDLVAFGQANLEAFVKSGQIWSAGVQELTKQMATSAKASFEESVSTFKAISSAKSVKEAMDLQSTFAKAAFEKAMAESNKLTDASIKLTEQTLAPITARVTVAVETFGKAA
jgi:phasin family protein